MITHIKTLYGTNQDSFGTNEILSMMIIHVDKLHKRLVRSIETCIVYRYFMIYIKI